MAKVIKQFRRLQLEQSGFSIIEVVIALIVITILVGLASSVSTTGLSINGRTTLYTDASSLAFKKVQDYANLSFENITVGNVSNSYEVEDFTSEAEAEGLDNPVAKVYVIPESQINTTTETITTTFSQSIAADTAFTSGSEIANIDVDDATGDYWREWRMGDDNYYNYTYSAFSSSPDNMASPSIDLGSSQVVDTIRVNWYGCGYGANNFRVEAKDSSPNTNSGWTTIVDGLSDNGIPCYVGSHPQDIDVSSNSTPYRHWRLFVIDAEDEDYNVFSELEAFSSASPGDTVEQHGADASSSPGALYFSSSDLEMSEDGSRGHQSIGMLFDGVDAAQGATIDDAYIEFTADEFDSGPVTLRVSGADVDNAAPWVGDFAVDNAVDADSTDGSVGTTAVTIWTPPTWSSGESGPDTRVDVTDIIQEIIDRAGWVSENDIALAVQYVSGSDKRVAERTPAPELFIQWSETTTTTTTNGYVDDDMDGDVDNPTLVRVQVLLEYDSYGTRQTITYDTFVRQYGIGS